MAGGPAVEWTTPVAGRATEGRQRERQQEQGTPERRPRLAASRGGSAAASVMTSVTTSSDMDNYNPDGVALVRTSGSSIPVRPEALAAHPQGAPAVVAGGSGDAIGSGDAPEAIECQQPVAPGSALTTPQPAAAGVAAARVAAAGEAPAGKRKGKKRAERKCRGARQHEKKKYRRDGE
jgi:hypothetical protein